MINRILIIPVLIVSIVLCVFVGLYFAIFEARDTHEPWRKK